jgi:hypothetical protein
MVRPATLLLVVVFALAACGGHSARSPVQVVNGNDNQGAASLFAAGAQVIQEGTIVLRGHQDAVAWNRGLPCGAKILSISVQGSNEVLVVFRLTERPAHVCDGPGLQAAAIFRVRDGKIVLWHQVPPPPPPAAGQTV